MVFFFRPQVNTLAANRITLRTPSGPDGGGAHVRPPYSSVPTRRKPTMNTTAMSATSSTP